jgi:hypothetical protein
MLAISALALAGAALDKASRVRLTVSPQAAPVPALKYTFVPEAIDQTPGNAALAYQQALRLLTQREGWKTNADQCTEWLKTPLAELPVAAIEKVITDHKTALEQLVKATLHERCDWELPIRQEGVALLLPHLAELRSASRLLAVEIRLRTRQERYDDAIRDIRAGLTLANHTGTGVTLIEGLVGIAIANMMLDRIEELIQQPGAPNLYWAMTDLPPAYLDAWRAMRWERCFLYIHFPILREAGTRRLTAMDLRKSFGQLHKMDGGIGLSAEFGSEDDRLALMAAAVAWVTYPKARQSLAQQGISLEALQAMSATDVLAAYFGGNYAIHRDNIVKWFALPYCQARQGLKDAQEAVDAAIREDPVGNLLPGMVLPALGNAARRYAESARKLAVLRCAEAIRLHAARQGRLPENLEAVEETPIPLNPMTGEPFAYRLEGQTAILELGAEAERRPSIPEAYEIVLR